LNIIQPKNIILVAVKLTTMDKVIATIDVTTPTGRKIVRELESHKRTVHIEYPLPDGTENAPTHKEVFS